MSSVDEENNFFKKWKKINEKTITSFVTGGNNSSSSGHLSVGGINGLHLNSKSSSSSSSHRHGGGGGVDQQLPYSSFLPSSNSSTNKRTLLPSSSDTSASLGDDTDPSSLTMTAASLPPSSSQRSTSNSSPSSPSHPSSSVSPLTSPSTLTLLTDPKQSYHYKKMDQILLSENIDLIALRKQSWNGIPQEFRCMVWQLLLGYLPTNKSRREVTLQKKRKEYLDLLPTYFSSTMDDERTTQESEILRQILVDLPRTCPNIPFFQQGFIQKAMERILYIWSIRHPASGYVQGMNDLLTPILLVFMNQSLIQETGGGNIITDNKVTISHSLVFQCDLTSVDISVINAVEADSYWCLTKLLDNIQDHYTFSQPGLQRMVCRLEDLIRRIDSDLHDHLQSQGVEYIQFAFRWMNCLLLRELPLSAILRLWDTYLSEERKGFDNFHVYVCAVLLKMWSEVLQGMQFQDILLFLQDLPTSTWAEEEMESILAQAYILSHLFEESPNHLT
jgi:TBC1 domain family member 2